MNSKDEFDSEEAFDALDDLEYDDGDYESSLLRWMSIGFVICAVIGFVALAWYAYENNMRPISEDEIPMVEAPKGDYKEKPEDPGGWQFDHQDKSVYNQLAAGEDSNRPVAERLLPAPEEPVQRPAAEELLARQLNPEPVGSGEGEGEVMLAPSQATTQADAEPKEADAEPEAAQQQTGEAVVTEVPSATNDEKSARVIEPKPATKPAAPAETTAPAAKAAPVKTAPGQYMVQLGSFRARADAEEAWGRVSKAHNARLSGKGHAIERADLGDKGIYYRLKYGPFDNESGAKSLCEYLQQNKQACLVVKVK